jgi:2-dehydropantoate 2-reductase
MKFAVVGAGAIGAFVGALLARTGENVTLIARGPHLQAMKEHGLRITGSLGEFDVRLAATDEPSAVGPVDVVLLTVKAHSLTQLAPRIAPLLGPETCVVSLQNGLPWWYFFRHGGEWEGTTLEAVDPGGVISRSIDAARVVGCVIYCSTRISEPGVVEFIEGNRFPIGEPDGSRSERTRLISEAFKKAGLRSPVRTNIRQDIWVKLMGNLAFNPLSALTRATLVDIVRFEGTREIATHVMTEIGELANRLGVDLGISIEQRLEGAASVGAHKTSMLQDVEAGRPLELEAIVGAVVELAGKLSIEIPYTRTLYSCTKLLERSLHGKENHGT